MSFETTLPVSGKAVVLRPMTGEHEEIMADKLLSRNPGKMFTELLLAALVTLDGVKPTKALVQAMTIPDRDFLLTEFRRASFGDTLVGDYVCSECGDKFTEETDLSQLPVTRAGEDYKEHVEVELADGLEVGGVLHKKAIMRRPTGQDQERTAVLMSQNASKGSTLMLTYCCEAIGEVRPSADQVKGLTMRDRQRMLKALELDTYGVDMMLTMTCPSCGAVNRQVLDNSAFFSER